MNHTTLADSRVKKFITKNSIWLILIVIVAIVTAIKPVFLTPTNLQTLITTESIKGILAFGVMFAILAKGIDLTPGATVAFVSVICASLAQTADASRKVLGFGPLPGWLIFLIGIAIGAAIGLIIGAIIAYTKIPPFIATLGGQLILRAASKMYSSIPVSSLSEDFRFFGKGDILGIPMIVVIFVLMFIISAILLTKTRFGRNVFAIGGNDNAARVAGISVERNLILVHMWCSICAAIGGVLLAGRTGSADPSTYGLNYELDAIAAATVGGTSHTGGVCRISGVLAGILILGVINNALILMGVDDNMTNIIKGLIIVGAVVVDMRKNAKKV